MHRRSLLLAAGALPLARPARALYDPAPDALLQRAVGAWQGTLRYQDYQRPDRQVTLPTSMVASLAAPAELVLYFAFDDGPGKTVHSYERMVFNFADRQLTWVSGTAKPSSNSYRIVDIAPAAGADGTATVKFERSVEGGTDAHVLELAPRSFALFKREVRTGKADIERSRYQYTRT